MNVTTSVISLVIAIVCAVVCYRTAIKKGRNPLGWTLLGFFLPLIGLVVVILLPDRSSARY
jgi:Na+-translocating ferredoxin:NAD+ oxidoreductase RnfA subunit